jgi:phage tail sheath gpL-like
MAEISVTGLAAGDPIPGLYEEVSFAAGPANTGTALRSAVLVGNKLSTGSATVEQVYGPSDFSTESDVIALFGSGSELHMMWLRFVFVNRTTPLYMIASAESAGAQATGTLTVTGTASANGVIRVYVGDRFVDVTVTSGDAQNTVATAIATAIGQQSKWPVTASATINVVTVTSRQKGPRGNSIRISAVTVGSFTTAITPTLPTALSGGTTADVLTNALSALNPKRYYYQAYAQEDVTNIGLVVTQINAHAVPLVGQRERCFFGANDTNGSASITIATNASVNAARAELVWQPDSDLTPAELAAHLTAVYSLYEAQARPRLNYNFCLVSRICG